MMKALADKKVRPRKNMKTGLGSCTVEPIREKVQIQAIKGVLAENARDYALFAVGIGTGLRASDLLGLKWEDVMTREGSFVERLEVLESKTGKLRRIALSDNCRKALERFAKDQASTTKGYLFKSRQGGMLTIARLHQLVNQWAGQAGVSGHYGTHTLRKTYGFHFYRMGYDLTLLMKAFGHSSQAITLRYIGVEQEQVDEANLKLNL